MSAGGASALAASTSAMATAHQGRGIVEQHHQRAFGGDAVVGGKIGVEVGARQRAGGIRPLGRRGGPHPLEEMTNDHDVTDATPRGLPTRAHISVCPLNKAFTITCCDY